MTGAWQKKYAPKPKITKVFCKENSVKAKSLDKSLDAYFRKKPK